MTKVIKNKSIIKYLYFYYELVFFNFITESNNNLKK